MTATPPPEVAGSPSASGPRTAVVVVNGRVGELPTRRVVSEEEDSQAVVVKVGVVDDTPGGAEHEDPVAVGVGNDVLELVTGARALGDLDAGEAVVSPRCRRGSDLRQWRCW